MPTAAPPLWNPDARGRDDATAASVLNVGVESRRPIDRLVDLVHSEPHRAATAAEARLAAADWVDQRERAQLHWVVGLAEREQGRLGAARATLGRAFSIAREGGDLEVSSRIQSSLAFVLGRQGDLDGAYALLLAAEQGASESQRARLLAQRGVVAHLRGELDDAARILAKATNDLKRHGDHIAEARHRANLGAVLSELGRFPSARRHLRRAITVAEGLGLDVVVGIATSTLGYMATLQGDLPGAIWYYAEAERRFDRAGADSYLGRVHADLAKALADAGLLEDAESLLARALDEFRAQGQRTELAGGLLTSSEIRLAHRDLDGAREAADEAATTLRDQGRLRWVALAENLALQASARADGAPAELIAALTTTAGTLERHGWQAEATRARLVAAKLLAESPAGCGRGVVAADTRRLVRRGRAVDRVLLAYVDAVTAEGDGDRRAARRSITNGLRIAMSAQAGLGAIETRAYAAAHAYELTEFGARLAITDNRPRELLARIEATRLMTSRMPMLRPPDDHSMAAMLTELRNLGVKIADLTTTAKDRVVAERLRIKIERRVRSDSRRVRGDQRPSTSLQAELGEALTLLDNRQLLAHAVLDGRLFAVSITSGRLRLHDLGPTDGIARSVESIGFAMHRLNRVQGSDASRRAAAVSIEVAGGELAQRLLPANVVSSPEPLVIVPTAALHDVPWGLLGPLAGRPVSVNPSVSAWAKAERSRRQRASVRHGSRTAGFVAGPGLEHAEREVTELGSLYGDATVLRGKDSTVPVCLDLLAQTDLVHIACHGTFRTDNPMFSALSLADGQLIVYDFERLPQLPEVVVLSACRAATAKALQGGSLLGLAAALTTMGACSVVAPLSPISDASSVPVMDHLHRALVAGSSPAEALAKAAGSRDVGLATAGAFVALGS